MRVTAAAQIARKIDVFASIIDRQFCESGGGFFGTDVLERIL